MAQLVKNLPANARDVSSIPGLGRFTGGGNGNLLQYSYLENPHVLEHFIEIYTVVTRISVGIGLDL